MNPRGIPLLVFSHAEGDSEERESEAVTVTGDGVFTYRPGRGLPGTFRGALQSWGCRYHVPKTP